MSSAVSVRAEAEHHFTITASIAFGWCTMEGIVHLIDDYKLLCHFRWGHLTYFGSRYFGILTTFCFLMLASLGQKGRLVCQGFYLAEHIASSLLFLSSGSMFWIRAGFICEWKRWIMIPLGIYGIVISALAMKLSFGDYKPGLDGSSMVDSTFVCSIESSTSSKDQAILRFLMASFDILTAIITFVFLYQRNTPQHSWLKTILIRDQLIYVCATTMVYIALGMDLIFNKVVYLGVLCPSIISIISCRLFSRLKREGSEEHHVRASNNLLSLSQQQQQQQHQAQMSQQEHKVVVEDKSTSPWYDQQSASCEIMQPPTTTAAPWCPSVGQDKSPDNARRCSPPLRISLGKINDQIKMEEKGSKT